jgi:hypothetical protein
MVFKFFVLLIYEAMQKYDGLDENTRHWHMLIALALAGLLIMQLIGGRRMIKTIKRNARHQLENSFA